MSTPFGTLLASQIESGRTTIPNLAAASGTGEHAVRGWLRGEYCPAATRLADIAAALDLPLADVVMAANGYAPTPADASLTTHPKANQ